METEVSSLAEVQLHEGESLESALKRFKRKVMTEDIIKEIKRHSFYLKPQTRAQEASEGWRTGSELILVSRML